jgi:hypothetical protein
MFNLDLQRAVGNNSANTCATLRGESGEVHNLSLPLAKVHSLIGRFCEGETDFEGSQSQIHWKRNNML